MPKRLAVRRAARLLTSPSAVAVKPQVVERPPVGDDAVREEAYRRWEQAGRPPGDGVQFWLEAERDLRG